MLLLVMICLAHKISDRLYATRCLFDSFRYPPVPTPERRPLRDIARDARRPHFGADAARNAEGGVLMFYISSYLDHCLVALPSHESSSLSPSGTIENSSPIRLVM